MKKIFSLFIALAAVLTANATDYYFAGAANSWNNNNAAWKFQEVEGVLTLEVADLYGEFKIAENGAWHPQHGAAAAGEGVALNGTYNLVKCDDSQGEADAPANCTIIMPETEFAEPRYQNAKLTLDASDPDHLVISLVAGTLYDHSVAPKTYQLVGAFQDWKADAGLATEFESVEGVLTATVADLSGSFKVIQDHSWANQWATNWDTHAGLELGVPYVLGAKGEKEPDNLALANPFGGYRNAVLTLTGMGEGETPTLTLVSGEFYVTENKWYFPGGYQEWKCNESAEFEGVAGVENMFELLLPSLSGEFKVSYGSWAVEFGAQTPGDIVAPNEPYAMKYGKDNLKVEDTLTDVTVTIVVDYENVAVQLTLGVEGAALEQIAAQKGAQKFVENGQVVIVKDGIRYTATGAKL